MTAKRRAPHSALVVLVTGVLLPPGIWAQPAPQIVTIEQPDAQRTKEHLSGIIDHYPPSLKSVLALDPSLLSNQAYLAAYPALTTFLTSHPDVARDPSFYFGDPDEHRDRGDSEAWQKFLETMSVFGGFGMAIGMAVWLIRTIIDYRRWGRLAKVQTDVHTKILDRFTANDELLAYMQSPAGAKFLESSPITLDAGPRSIGAPLGRILWSVQAGLVLAAAGIGLNVVSARFTDDASKPLQVLGVLGVALGIGFVVSAIISFVLSRKLGLIESTRSE